MLITTANDLPGHQIVETLGEVFGLTVRSRNVGSQIGAGLKSLVGGELKGMTHALVDSRLQVIQRMTDEAEAKLAWQLCSWFKATLSWQFLTTAYRTDTRPAVDPITLVTVSPGGNLVAYDPATGAILWHVHLGEVSGPAQTYMLDGKQYLLVSAVDSLYAFALN